MDVCTILLHIFNKKFWLQCICNKLISTTAHESVKIISTKWFMHISHLISVNIFLENFDTFCLFDLYINNINVPGQRICSHFLVQISRADAEIVTHKLPLIFFINMLLLYFNVQYTNAYFYWSLRESDEETETVWRNLSVPRKWLLLFK
jgi:hypothetical protein